MDLSDVLRALRNADAAGDTAAAQQLAGIAQRMMQEEEDEPAPAAPPKPKKSGVMASAGRGLESLVSSLRTAGGATFGDADEAARAGLARGEDIENRYERQVGLDKLKEVYDRDGLVSAGGEALRQVPHALAEQAPNIALTLGGAKAGALAGSVAGPVGSVVGGLAGAALPSMAAQFGGNVERQAAEQQQAGKPVSVDRGAAAAAAAPQAALDVAGTFIPLGGRLVSKLTGIPTEALLGKTAAQAAKLAEERLVVTLTKGLATGALAEIPTEVAQQMLERLQAGLPLTSPDALKEYGETAYQSGLLAPVGAAGRLSSKAGARQQLVVEEDAKRATALQEQEQAKAKEAEALEARRQTPEYALEVEQKYRALEEQTAKLTQVARAGRAQGADIATKQAAGEAWKQLNALKKDEASQSLVREYRAVLPVLERARKDRAAAETAAIEQRQAQIEQSTQQPTADQPVYNGPSSPQQDMFGGQPKTVTPAPDERANEAQGLATRKRQLESLLESQQQEESDAAGAGNIDKLRQLRQRGQLLRNEYEFVAKQLDALGGEGALASGVDNLVALVEKYKKQLTAMAGPGYDPAKADKILQKIGELEQQLKDAGYTPGTPVKQQGLGARAERMPFSESRSEWSARKYEQPPQQQVLDDQEQDALAQREADMQAAATEAERAKKIAPEVNALRRIGERPAGKVGETQVSTEVDRLVESTQQQAREKSPAPKGRVIEGTGVSTLDERQRAMARLAYAKATRDEHLIGETKKELDALREEPEGITGGDIEAGETLKDRGIEGRLSEGAKRANAVTRLSQQQLAAYDELVDFLTETRETDQNELNVERAKMQAGLSQQTIMGLALQEVAARREQAGMPPLTPQETSSLIGQMNGTLRELVTRSAGAFSPKGQQVIAQMRGTKIVANRPVPQEPGKRLFGNPQAAANTLRAQVRAAIDKAAGTKAPEHKEPPKPKVQKVTPPLRTEFQGTARSDKELFARAKEKGGDEIELAERRFEYLTPAVKQEVRDELYKVLTGRKFELSERAQSEIAALREAAQDEGPQKRLFSETSDRMVVRQSHRNFMAYLQGGEVYKLRMALQQEKARARAAAASAIARAKKLEKSFDALIRPLIAKEPLTVDEAKGQLEKTAAQTAAARAAAEQLRAQRERAAQERAKVQKDLDSLKALRDESNARIKELQELQESLVSEPQAKAAEQTLNEALAEHQRVVDAYEDAVKRKRELEIDFIKEDLANDTVDKAILRKGEQAEQRVEEARKKLAEAEAAEKEARDGVWRIRAESKAEIASAEFDEAPNVQKRLNELREQYAQAENEYQQAKKQADAAQSKRLEVERAEKEGADLEGLIRATELRNERQNSGGADAELRARRALNRMRELQENILSLPRAKGAEVQPAKQLPTTQVYRDTMDPAVQTKIKKLRKAVAMEEANYLKAMEAKNRAAMTRAERLVAKHYLEIYDALENAPRVKVTPEMAGEAKAMEEFERAQMLAANESAKYFYERAGLPEPRLKKLEPVKRYKTLWSPKGNDYEVQQRVANKVMATKDLTAEQLEKANAQPPQVSDTYPKQLGPQTDRRRSEMTEQDMKAEERDVLQHIAAKRAEFVDVQRQIAYINEHPAATPEGKKKQATALKAARERGKQLTQELRELTAKQKAVVREAKEETRASKNIRTEARRRLKAEPEAEPEAEEDVLPPSRTQRAVDDETMLQAAATAKQGPRLALNWDENLASVMNKVEQQTRDPVSKAVAARLKMLVGNSQIELVDDLRDDKGVPAYGMATVDGTKIKLDSRFGANEQTVLHEATHAAVERALRMPEEQLTPEQLRAKNELQALYDAYLKDADGPSANARKSLSEFVSEALSDVQLQEYMRAKPWTLKHMWQSFKSAILKMLGVDVPANMRDAALAAADNLMMRVARPEPGQINKAPEYLLRPKASKEWAGAIQNSERFIAKEQPLYQRVRNNGAGLWFETKLVDRFAALDRMSKMMDSLKGTQMMYWARMYDQRFHHVAQAAGTGVPQRREIKRADGQREFILEAKDGGSSLRTVVQALRPAAKVIGSGDAVNRAFTMYMSAIRAKNKGIQVLNFKDLKQADLDEVTNLVNATPGVKEAFEAARREYNQYNRDLLNLLVDSGAIHKDVAAKLLKEDDYIPWYRAKDGNAVLQIGTEAPITVGSLKNQPHLQELVGGDQPIMDFMTSSVQNTNMIIDMALRNLATKDAVFRLQEIGAAKILHGEASGPDIVQYKDDGRDRYARIETDEKGVSAELLVQGMAGIPTQPTGLLKAMGLPAKVLRKAVTLSPLYAARQLFRDSVAATMISGADFTPVLGALSQINSKTKGVLERRGVVGGQIFTGTREDMADILRRISEGKSGWQEALSKLETISMEADALTRRAQYESFRKQGLSEMEATLMALESMNFSKRGASPSVWMMNTIIPFFNAQVQGLNVLYKAFTGKMPFNDRLRIREKLIARGMLLMGLSLAYAASMQDDEAYKNANPDQKYGNWFVRIPGVDEPVKIPVPFEIGYIFKALPEALYNMAVNEHGSEEAFKAFRQILLQTVPGGSSYFMPQAAKPAIEGLLGKSFYTQRDILTAKEQAMLPEAQYRPETSEFAKALGSTFGISPVKFEQLISGYFSTLGVAALHVGDPFLAGDDSPEKATRRLSQTPIIGGAFQANDAGGITNAVYEQMMEYKKVKSTVDDLLKRGEKAEAMALLESKSGDYARAQMTDRFTAMMTKISQAEVAVRASSLSPAEKRERLDHLRQAKIRISAAVREASDQTTRPALQP